MARTCFTRTRSPKMPIDLPPNLANTAASAIVRQAEKQNNTPNRSQEEARIKNEGQKAQDAAKKK